MLTLEESRRGFTRRCSLGAPRLALLGIFLLLLAAPLPAAQSGLTSALDVQSATSQLEVRVRARALAPGEVVRLDISSPTALTRVVVTVPWHPVVPFTITPNRWRALVGLDLDLEAGDHIIAVGADTAAGDHLATTQIVHVESKEFPTRSLQVAPRFVTPPAGAEKRIERERMALSRLFRAARPEPDWHEPFILPIAGAVVSGFGVRSVFNHEPRAPHGGADFASPAGTPVAAPAAGVVVLADDLYFTGNTVVIDHGVGLQSLFAHLSRADVRRGDAVTRGQIVGAVGSTGRATGPHLHWTVRLNGARVDPLSLIYALEE